MKLVFLFFTLLGNIAWADTELNLGDVLKCNVVGRGIETPRGPQDRNIKLKYSKADDNYSAQIGKFEVSVGAARVDGVLTATVFYGLSNSGALLSSSTGFVLIKKNSDTDMGYLEFDSQMLTVTCRMKK